LRTKNYVACVYNVAFRGLNTNKVDYNQLESRHGSGN